MMMPLANQPETGTPSRSGYPASGPSLHAVYSQSLPQMSALERADLSRMAQRTFSSDVEAYRFWHELVETAAFFQMFEGRA